MNRRRMTVQEAALAVVRRLREGGHQALWAGGCVRDMLLGQAPQDIDVATDAPPHRVVELFSHARKVGAKFGVVMVRQGPHWIETATFRSDLDYRDGRHPERVVFTTAEEDAQRRDFTINGLFFDPLGEEVIDYVDGRRDLSDGILRAIGDPSLRFEEDHLRMLRAVRFAARFGLQIEQATADAIKDHARQITRISPERIRQELDKMFAHPTRADALRLTAELKLVDHLWTGHSWPDQRVRTGLAVFQALPRSADFVLAMAALFHDAPTEAVKRVARELRCSNLQTDDTAWLVGRIEQINYVESLSLSAFKRLAAHDRFDDLLSLHRAICVAGKLPLEANQAARQRKLDIPPAELAPPPLVTGEDLIEEGLEPGPDFKRILDRLYDEQLDNRLATREQALEKLRQLVTDR